MIQGLFATLIIVSAIGGALVAVQRDAEAAAALRRPDGAPGEWWALEPVRACLTVPPVGTPIYGDLSRLD